MTALLLIAVLSIGVGIWTGMRLAPERVTTEIITQTFTTEIHETILVPQPPDASQNWKTIQAFTGTGDFETQNFQVEAKEWRLQITIAVKEPGYAGFTVYIVPEGQDEHHYVAEGHMPNVSGTGYVYIHHEPGSYYLKIYANGLETWTVRVQTTQ